ncbi:hypothetical protein KUTeg_023364 [Tegillarca granosa]|uniref:Phosphoacetylglucosamine mutase n=1 Tax=Tegillarca granosa TaxID=220873 RepID=A0ABQ9E1U2_TEGGR|nr:hypothetical protein KUTeg_023364 [Tegillarca granosa]
MERIEEVANRLHPRTGTKFIQYGTAGFRTKGSELDHVMYRMGILAVLRAKLKGATIGVMITASHNPEEDNGIKLVDPMGEMLESAWEKYATELANVNDSELMITVKKIASKEQIDLNSGTSPVIFCAYDTRPSSIPLSEAVRDGIEAAGGSLCNFGKLTTPQLHYMVRCKNTDNCYGTSTEEGYYQKLSLAFIKLRQIQGQTQKYQNTVVVDAANGIGAEKAKFLKTYLKDSLNIEIHNDGTNGRLNYLCGADYVKVQQKAPNGLTLKAGSKYASFDGDADRIVYYYVDNGGTFHLLDGDKIASLVASYLQTLVSESGLTVNLGLVQTAYANGSSTDFITQTLQVPVVCVPTGVKHLHARALQFDIGVYFEANGHGTVLFSDAVTEKIRSAASDVNLTDKQRKSASELCIAINLINQTVGDAISDMLLVEIVLGTQDLDIENWDKMYTDLPNRQLKVKVQDRTVIETTDAERRAVKPAGLQENVDNLVSKVPNGRSFVRPSGTEDVVRIYAEADTQQNADKLAVEVALKVYDLAGGVGDKPHLPL